MERGIMKNRSFLLLIIGVLVGVIMGAGSCLVSAKGMYWLGGLLFCGSVVVSGVCSYVARDLNNSKKDK